MLPPSPMNATDGALHDKISIIILSSSITPQHVYKYNHTTRSARFTDFSYWPMNKYSYRSVKIIVNTIRCSYTYFLRNEIWTNPRQVHLIDLCVDIGLSMSPRLAGWRWWVFKKINKILGIEQNRYKFHIASMKGELLYWTCVKKYSVSTTGETCNNVSKPIKVTPSDGTGPRDPAPSLISAYCNHRLCKLTS